MGTNHKPTPLHYRRIRPEEFWLFGTNVNDNGQQYQQHHRFHSHESPLALGEEELTYFSKSQQTVHQLYLGGLCFLWFFHARTDSSVVLYGITWKQWEDVVGHTLAFGWQRRQSLAERCTQSPIDNPFLEMLVEPCLGPTACGCPEGPCHVVCSCCSRTQASCLLVLLLGDVAVPHFSAVTFQEGHFNKIPVSRDSA